MSNDSAPKYVYKTIGLKIRDRDLEMYELLSDKGIQPGQIFRLGLVTAIERIKDMDPEELEGLWERIAKKSILGG